MTLLARYVSHRWLAAAVLTFALSLAPIGCGGGGSRRGSPSAPKSPSTASAPACRAGQLTPAAVEGPFYKPGSPQRERLTEPGLTGQPLTISGSVLTSDCRPIAHALLQFWQADTRGHYDQRGFRLRGHEYTDARGRYKLATILPGLYPGRTRHLHVKVAPPGGKVLTTQLYFPNEPRNRTDPLFAVKLLLPLAKAGSGWAARFDFVVRG